MKITPKPGALPEAVASRRGQPPSLARRLREQQAPQRGRDRPTVPWPPSPRALCPCSRSAPPHPSEDSSQADPPPTPFSPAHPPYLSVQRPTPVTGGIQALSSLCGQRGPWVQRGKDEVAPGLASPGLWNRPLALPRVSCWPLPGSP